MNLQGLQMYGGAVKSAKGDVVVDHYFAAIDQKLMKATGHRGDRKVVLPEMLKERL